MLRTVCLAASIVAVTVTGALAECDSFKWPIARERAWLAAPQPADGSGQASPEKGYAMTLKPESAAEYVLPLKKKSAGDAFGGVIRLAPVSTPGIYQVTLSQEAWVDVIQNNARARTRGVARGSDCEGVRKSVRFELKAGAAALQLSGVKSQTVEVVFASAP